MGYLVNFWDAVQRLVGSFQEILPLLVSSKLDVNVIHKFLLQLDTVVKKFVKSKKYLQANKKLGQI